MVTREYDDSKEKTTQLCVVDLNRRGDKVIVSIVDKEDDGTSWVDIRRYYTADDDTVRPTSTGWRYKRDEENDALVTAVIINALIDSMSPEALDDVESHIKEVREALD